MRKILASKGLEGTLVSVRWHVKGIRKKENENVCKGGSSLAGKVGESLFLQEMVRVTHEEPRFWLCNAERIKSVYYKGTGFGS